MDSSSTSGDDQMSTLSSAKKVRFDLNDEVFEIPNKWGRLSTRTNARRNKLVEEVSKGTKGKIMESDQRGKNKQNKSKKVKKPVKKVDSKYRVTTTRPLASPSNHVLSLESTVLSTQRAGVSDKNSTVENRTKKGTQTSTPEVKLKLSHRGSIDNPSNDIVLPKISYSSDLKKAIENAVVRNRISAQEMGGSLNTARERYQSRISPQEIFDNHTRTYQKMTGDNVNLSPSKHPNTPCRSPTNEDLVYSTRKNERLVRLPEHEPKFSELSRNVESWIPFATGDPRDNQRRNSKSGSLQSTWIVPNSILY